MSSSNNTNSDNGKSSFLRRCSISDPRLDILPNFTQEKSYNPFNRVFSGILGEGNSTFSLNKGTSSDSMDNEGHQILHDIPNKPKGGTVVDIKNTSGTVPSTGLKKSATSISAFFGSSPTHSQHHHHFTTIPETEDRGLIMSTRTENTHRDAQQNISANTGSAAVTTTPKTGFFGIGFLSKPVLHSQEENYRYIMALDR